MLFTQGEGVNEMKKLSYLFFSLSVLISYVAVWVVAFEYRGYICAIEHKGFSAPATVALLSAIPFIIIILTFAILGFVFYKKANPRK